MSNDNKNYIEEFNEYLREIKELQTKLTSQLSEYDKQQEDILHFIEFGKYNAVTMMKVTKKLRNVRIKRREVKNKLELLIPICSRIGKNELKCANKKCYAFKTNILSEITESKTI